MTKIEDLLQQILVARYGEDVRGSIHDAIEMISKIAGIKYGTEITSETSPSGNYQIGTFYFNDDTYDLWCMIAKDSWDFIANIKGTPGEDGAPGRDGTPGEDGATPTGIVEISHVGLIHTYELQFSNGAAFPFTVMDGQSGSGTGNMRWETYDTNQDGIVDEADHASRADSAINATNAEKAENLIDEDGNVLTVEDIKSKAAYQILGTINGDTVTFTDTTYIGGTDDYLLDPYISDTDRFLKSQSISGHTLTIVCDDTIKSGSVAVCLAFKKGV